MKDETTRLKIARLEKELNEAKREQSMEDEIKSGVCPLCGSNLRYHYEDRAIGAGGDGNKIQKLTIKCIGCGYFGVDYEKTYNEIDVAMGRQSKPIDKHKVWDSMKQYVMFKIKD